jgi:hypothetical protein
MSETRDQISEPLSKAYIRLNSNGVRVCIKSDDGNNGGVTQLNSESRY